jgi:hypothetical protein
MKTKRLRLPHKISKVIIKIDGQWFLVINSCQEKKAPKTG